MRDRLVSTLVRCLVCALLAGCAELTGSDPDADPPEPAPAAPPPAAAPASEAAPPAPAPALPAAPEVILGSGEFVGPPPPRQPVVAADGEITLNFVDADVREVVRSVLGDTLGANYVIDPEVAGTVTLQTSRPLARAAVLPTLEEVLRLNGAALVDEDGLYRIVPIERAAQAAGGARLRGTPRGPGFGLEVIPLEYVAAAEMRAILDPVAPSGAIPVVDETRNLIIAAGTRRELATIRDLVAMFDVDWFAGMSFALVPLEFTNAEALIGDLEAVFGDQADGPLAGLLRFVPIERINAVLAISPQRAYLRDARAWIERLDRSGDGVEQRLYVYDVQNGRAADLAETLTRIFGGEAPTAEPEPEVAPGLRPVELSSSVRTSDLGGALRAAQPEAVPAPESEPAPPPLPEAPAAPAPRTEAPAADEGLAVVGSEAVRIIANERTNALVVLATPRQYRMIQAALEKLDIVPLQVLIEAVIAEVALDDELRFGVQWFLSEGNHSFTLSEVAGGAAAQAFPGFSYLFETSDTRTVINALDSVTDVDVVSAPQLFVVDNHPARLQVGDQVPVATQSAVSVVDPDSPIVNTVEFVDTGVILEVTPRVNAGGMVIMEIEQQVSDVIETTTSGIDSPTIQQRQIASTVAIQTGETVVLGGLIRDRAELGESGVPVLKDIPLIGRLFGEVSERRRRTELLVLITPRVVRDTAEARAVTEELRRRLPQLKPLKEMVE